MNTIYKFAFVFFVFVNTWTDGHCQERGSLEDGRLLAIFDYPQSDSVDSNDPIIILSIDKLTAEFATNEIFFDSLSINPDWIASINVFKAQKAIEKYGVRGRNGVVLIDLKKDSFSKLPAAVKARLKE